VQTDNAIAPTPDASLSEVASHPSFSISTHWNAFRHEDGEAMIEEILNDTGLTEIELGYDLRMDLVEGVTKMVASGAVTVSSLHNFCPVPAGASMGHPEIWLLASKEHRVRESAIVNTRRTIEFAGELGASAVVCHAGYVDMKHMTRDLVRLIRDDKQFSKKYEKRKDKMLLLREKKAPEQIEILKDSLDALIPALEAANVTLGLENLPTWEAIPTEVEMDRLSQHFEGKPIGYWHDMGHGQIRQNLGLITHRRWLEKLGPALCGMHVHDVSDQVRDHVMPPHGCIDFNLYKDIIPNNIPLVFEPAPDTPAEAIREGIRIVRDAWAN
jgi:sugar phosphate isomerase/epimerase